MSRTKEQIIWKNEFLDFACFDLEKFQEIVKEASSKVQEEFKKESFIRFSSSEKYGDTTCLIEIGHNRPETEEERIAFDKMQENLQRASFNKAKAEYERLKAKFETQN